jgi:hypothetical protein
MYGISTITQRCSKCNVLDVTIVAGRVAAPPMQPRSAASTPAKLPALSRDELNALINELDKT